MRLFIHNLKLRYALFKFNAGIWFKDLKEEARKLQGSAIKVEKQYDVRKQKYMRGIKKMTQALRNNPETWKQPDKDLMEAANGVDKTAVERHAEMEIRRRLITETKLEDESGMAQTFTEQQPKYRLQARRQKAFKQLKQAVKDGNTSAIERCNLELSEIRTELEGLQ